MERPKTSAGKPKWIAYADELEGATPTAAPAFTAGRLHEKIAELEEAATGYRRDIAHLKRENRTLRNK